MPLSLHDLTVGTFAPMLQSLSEVLDKGAAHAEAAGLDLVNARLAPDMFTLAQQVQQACHAARDAMSRLSGRGAATLEEPETSFAGFQGQIRRTIDAVRSVAPAALIDAEERDCAIDMPQFVIAVNGLQLVRAWSLPHFYFHVVTAYDILRHHGVEIGKKDYLSQVAAFVRPKG
jgi:hypothetical protein